MPSQASPTREYPLRFAYAQGMRPFRDWPFRRVDYIFLRFGAHGGNALDIAGCDLAFDEPINGVWASDHFGLVADLTKPLP